LQKPLDNLRRLAYIRFMGQIVTPPRRNAMNYADEIFDNLCRIGVSTNQRPYSGLMCDEMCIVYYSEGSPTPVVKVYDDYESDLYDAPMLLELLRGLQVEPENIWETIRGCVIG
jgi:hypothetical protein